MGGDMALAEPGTTAAEDFAILPGTGEGGKPIFALLVKRTYDIRPGQIAFRAERDRPLLKIDEYYDHGDPEWSTVMHESDLAPYKPATDVVLVGKAHALGGKPVYLLDVTLIVGDRVKNIRVTGDRRCLWREDGPPVFTDPVPFTEMEIRYERAYGGWDRLSLPGIPFAYPRNHMGRGLAVRNLREVVEGLELPNLEDIEDPLTPERVVLGEPTQWNDQPLPVGFGWFQKTWYPRCSYVGSVPGYVSVGDTMREEGLGLVPKNQIALARQFRLPSFDPRFNNGASIGLVLPYLAGGERVALFHLTASGRLEFRLPQEKPAMTLDIGLGAKELAPVLHTVSIRPEEMQVDLVWRGALEYPGVDWLPEMKRLHGEVG